MLDVGDALQKGENPVLRAECGWGKTAGGAFIMDWASDTLGWNCLWLNHLQVLLHQSSAAFDAYGLTHELWHGRRRSAFRGGKVLLSTPQTCARSMPENWKPDLLVVDECHIKFDAAAEIAMDVKARGGVVLGLSATPTAEGMDAIYDRIIEPMTYVGMCDEGLLCRAKLYHTTPIDMTDAPVSAGEWKAKDVDARTSAHIIGDIISNAEKLWERHWSGPVPTIGSCRLVDTCERMAAAFEKAGHKAAVVSSRDPDNKETFLLRRKLFKDLAHGSINVVFSPKVLAIGFDCPPVRMVIGANPYRNPQAAIRQMHQFYLRGSRIHPGKDFFCILDASGNLSRHAPSWFDFCQNGHDDLANAKQPSKGGKPTLKDCPECGAYNSPSARKCRECGHEFPPPVAKAKKVDGEMREFKAPSELPDDTLLINIERHFYPIYGPWGFVARSGKTFDRERLRKMCLANFRKIKGRWPQGCESVVNAIGERRNVPPAIPAVSALINQMRSDWIKKNRKAAQRQAKQTADGMRLGDRWKRECSADEYKAAKGV